MQKDDVVFYRQRNHRVLSILNDMILIQDMTRRYNTYWVKSDLVMWLGRAAS